MAEDGFKVNVYHDPDYLQFLGINSQRQLAEAAAVLRDRILDVHFENGVTIIDPKTVSIDAGVEIGAGTVIGPFTVIQQAKIGENCQIGPFAYIRKGTVVGDRSRIGDFVEVKNATLGNNTKASHLAYIGDAEIGDNVNFGCGAITANYDGVNKHRTVVEDGAFIGSNVNLIAPVTVRSDAFVAAGSTITDEVPSGAFAIARERQTTKENGAQKYKK
jgi:bifunctional UDP-N-acetylglucosamine pyrophosphorylase/glucosamine-1-phosphate N-acetyltransferase